MPKATSYTKKLSKRVNRRLSSNKKKLDKIRRENKALKKTQGRLKKYK